MSKVYDVAVIGGGAAGLAAAISAGRRGARTVLCDRMPRLGKKILITGGGRCNLSNENVAPSSFTSGSKALVRAVLDRFDGEAILKFFRELGLELAAEGGRIFPATNQAASVLRVLELEVRRLGVAVELGFETADIRSEAGLFTASAGDGRRVGARSVVLSAGGRAYPALGSNGSGYRLAQHFGHSVVAPVPSAVPLTAKDRLCHLLQGQKVKARAAAEVDGRRGPAVEGDVLFTPYGLSGTAVLDVSESVSVALNRSGRPGAAVVLDLVPYLARNLLAAKLEKRFASGWEPADVAAGILPEKFGPAIAGMVPAAAREAGEKAAALASTLKERRFAVYGTRGWNEAEFTCGGIDAGEIEPRTLRSRRQEGLDLAGEILDVQGPRGGFNLAWAWASGYVAGLTE